MVERKAMNMWAKVFICVVLLVSGSSVWALLQVNVVDGCPVGVVDTTPQPNCPENAACRNRGQTVHWQRSDGGMDFSLDFSDTSIFDGWGSGTCTSNAQGGQIVCRIAENAASGDYKYDVEAEECVLDPRLVIR